MANYEGFEGHPADEAGRLPREIRCYDLLDELRIPYLRTDHPAAFTMEACEEIDAVLGTTMCKNLFLTNRQHTAYYLLMMPGQKVFKTKELSSQIGSARLSFASGDEMEQYLGCAPGSSSVMGLMNDRERAVRLLVDEEVLAQEYLGCHPCVNTSSLRIRMRDLTERFLPAVGHDLTVVKLTGEA